MGRAIGKGGVGIFRDLGETNRASYKILWMPGDYPVISRYEIEISR
jgi:hypothetical protein